MLFPPSLSLNSLPLFSTLLPLLLVGNRSQSCCLSCLCFFLYKWAQSMSQSNLLKNYIYERTILSFTKLQCVSVWVLSFVFYSTDTFVLPCNSTICFNYSGFNYAYYLVGISFLIIFYGKLVYWRYYFVLPSFI